MSDSGPSSTLEAFASRWVVALLALVGLLVGLGLFSLRDSVYESSAIVSVNNPIGTMGDEAALVLSDRVLSPATATLGFTPELQVEPNEVADLLTITVRANDPFQAARAATQVAEIYVQSQTSVAVRIAGEAEPNPSPVAPNRLAYVLIGSMVGALAGLLVSSMRSLRQIIPERAPAPERPKPIRPPRQPGASPALATLATEADELTSPDQASPAQIAGVPTPRAQAVRDPAPPAKTAAHTAVRSTVFTSAATSMLASPPTSPPASPWRSDSSQGDSPSPDQPATRSEPKRMAAKRVAAERLAAEVAARKRVSVEQAPEPTSARQPDPAGAMLGEDQSDHGARASSVHDHNQVNVRQHAVEQDTVEPNTVEPNTVEPNTVEPNTVEPNTVEPNTVEPNTVEQDTVEWGDLEADMGAANSQIHALRIQHDIELNDQDLAHAETLSAVEADFERDLEALKRELADARKQARVSTAQVKRLAGDDQHRIGDLQAQATALEAEITTLRDQLEGERISNLRDLASERDAADRALDNARRDFQNRLDVIESETRRTMSHSRTELDDVLTDARAEHQSALERQHREYDDALARDRESHKVDLARLVERHRHEVASVREQTGKETERQLHSTKQTIAALRATEKRLLGEVQELRQTESQFRTELTSARKNSRYAQQKFSTTEQALRDELALAKKVVQGEKERNAALRDDVVRRTAEAHQVVDQAIDDRSAQLTELELLVSRQRKHAEERIRETTASADERARDSARREAELTAHITRLERELDQLRPQTG